MQVEYLPQMEMEIRSQSVSDLVFFISFIFL